MVTDGVGTLGVSKGAIIAWTDYRTDPGGDIYVQRLNAAGAAQWTAGGRPVCTDASAQFAPAIAFASSGSAIIGWTDRRNGNDDIYAQLEGASGDGWLANGLPVCQASGSQILPKAIGDSKGGALFAWEDARDDAGDVYAQRVNGAGSSLWSAGGIPLCTAANQQRGLALVGDLSSGLICAWSDRRSSALDDVYAQRADSTGTTLWGNQGVVVCQASGTQRNAAVATDGTAGVVAAWSDERDGTSSDDIYAYHVPAVVTAVDPGPAVARFQLLEPLPNPTSGATTLSLVLPAPGAVTARVFRADGRLIRTLAERRVLPAGTSALRWDGTDAAGRRAASGIYLIRVESEGETGVRRVSVLR